MSKFELFAEKWENFLLFATDIGCEIPEGSFNPEYAYEILACIIGDLDEPMRRKVINATLTRAEARAWLEGTPVFARFVPVLDAVTDEQEDKFRRYMGLFAMCVTD